MRALASSPLAAPATAVMTPMSSSSRRRRMTVESQRSMTLMPELVGHVLLGFVEPHLPGELHPGYQISGGPDAAHRRGEGVADGHPRGIARAHLQAVDLADLDHRGAAAGDHVDRRDLEHRHAADAHAHVGVDGDLRVRGARLDEGDGARQVPRRAPARVGVDDRPEDVRAGLLARPPSAGAATCRPGACRCTRAGRGSRARTRPPCRPRRRGRCSRPPTRRRAAWRGTRRRRSRPWCRS